MAYNSGSAPSLTLSIKVTLGDTTSYNVVLCNDRQSTDFVTVACNIMYDQSFLRDAMDGYNMRSFGCVLGPGNFHSLDLAEMIIRSIDEVLGTPSKRLLELLQTSSLKG